CAGFALTRCAAVAMSQRVRPVVSPGLPRVRNLISAHGRKRESGPTSAFSKHAQMSIALLRIERMHLEVPVFNGTDDWILNLGAGRIVGTVAPGQKGNIGIAGHRDGFFRSLKYVDEFNLR